MNKGVALLIGWSIATVILGVAEAKREEKSHKETQEAFNGRN